MKQETLSFRPLCMDDAERITSIISAPKVLQYMNLPIPYELRHAQEFLQRCTEQNLPQRAIIINGQLAGCIGLAPSPSGDTTELMVGYWLGCAYHGRGLATRMLQQFLDQELPLLVTAPAVRLICAFTHKDNIASQRVLEKSGFTCTGSVSEYNGKPLPFQNARRFEISLN